MSQVNMVIPRHHRFERGCHSVSTGRALILPPMDSCCEKAFLATTMTYGDSGLYHRVELRGQIVRTGGVFVCMGI